MQSHLRSSAVLAEVENRVCEEFLYDIKGGLRPPGLRAALRAVLARSLSPPRPGLSRTAARVPDTRVVLMCLLAD